MKKHTEDEKPQGVEGARFGSGKHGFKKNTTIGTRATSHILQENSSRELVSALGHMGQKCT